MKMAALWACVLLFAAPAYAGEELGNTVKGTHFIVHYRAAPEAFAQKVLSEAERDYEKITDDLGLLRRDFWLWDNRATIYVCDDATQYQQAAKMPAWSAGASLPKEKVVYVFQGKENLFESVLPHELGHIIFREFVGFDNPAVPLWMDEGAASYQQGRLNFRPALEALIRKRGGLIPLDELGSLKPHEMADREDVEQFYAEAASVIDFLIHSFGKENFVIFCRSLRDTRDLSRALSYSYTIRDIRELDRRWQAYVK